MKIPLNWLKLYIDINLDKDEIAKKFTLSGIEVEKEVKTDEDVIFDVEITPNRSDLLSMIGIARESSAIFDKEFSLPVLKNTAYACSVKEIKITIENEDKCPFYSCQVLENVSIKQSSDDIAKKLKTAGIRTVNNAVDATNFCMFESGQPLHVFDYDKIKGDCITIRNAKKGEKIITIDCQEINLLPEDLVIADERGPIAIAGIMGGKNTEVDAETKNIVLESACFNPLSIRKTSRRLGIITESSYRFERGINFDMVAFSRQRAVEIIKESSDSMSEGKPVEQLSAKKIKAFKKTVNLNVLKIKKLLDIEIKPEEAVKIFNKMGINSVVLEDKNIIKTEIPSFREDLARDVDLIEELARIKGYDKIPAIIPLPSKNEFLEKKTISLYQKEKWARDAMICLGMNEIITYSLLSREDVEKFGYKGKDLIKIANPLSCEQEILRPVMIPSFLKVAAWNINRSNNNLRFFETGKTYHFTGEDNIEIRKIAVGIFRPAEYDIKNNIDKGKLFLELKGILEAFFCKLMITNFIFSPGTSSQYFYPGINADIHINGRKIGTAGYVLKDILNNFGIQEGIMAFCEMNTEVILEEIPSTNKKYKSIIKYPPSFRDISMVVKENLYFSVIKNTVIKIGGNLIKNVEFLEEYKGKQIPRGKKSLSCRITFQAEDRTLSDGEVDGIYKEVISLIQEQFEAKIR